LIKLNSCHLQTLTANGKYKLSFSKSAKVRGFICLRADVAKIAPWIRPGLTVEQFAVWQQ
jgi:hypothetical protein